MVVPALCLGSKLLQGGPGLQGVFMHRCLDVVTLCHSCARVPCPVLFCVRSVGARQGCRDLRRSPPGPERHTGCRWAGTWPQCVWPQCAQHLPGGTSAPVL